MEENKKNKGIDQATYKPLPDLWMGEYAFFKFITENDFLTGFKSKSIKEIEEIN